eukprot:m.199562 g.199562  ORF g.199562 m.199562 type:complete len:559 (+) comp32739_c0_seq1:37-1713(+)
MASVRFLEEWGDKKIDVNRPGFLDMEIRTNILHYYDQILDVSRVDGYDIADHLPGPLSDVGNKYESKKDVFLQLTDPATEGKMHIEWTNVQNTYCGGDSTANFVLPHLSLVPMNKRPPLITNMVVLCHPEDCQRIANTHVKKNPDYTNFLGTGVLSTLDNNAWKAQRDHFVPAFLPFSSLSKVCPTNVKRAQFSIQELNTLKDKGSGVVNMNEFLLNEAMAQLQLSLFGLPEDFVEETNRPLRKGFDSITIATGISGISDDRYLDVDTLMEDGSYSAMWVSKYLKLVKHKQREAETSGCPFVTGPLTKKILSGPHQFFNTSTFVFAGHDTTANTMSWLLLEVSRRPAIQQRLQSESDALFKQTAGRDIEYNDLRMLPFLWRCILETLRKWPVVPNGTGRELEFDEMVRGPGNKMVKLPKGTYVQITNWPRHRSKKLWGADVDEWNPERDFTEQELGYGGNMIGWNPASKRFSPFTYTPRDCMGKNFAQMEMRVIMSHLFHNFSFELTDDLMNVDQSKFLGVNRGTMGPQKISNAPHRGPELGLDLRVTTRVHTPPAKL